MKRGYTPYGESAVTSGSALSRLQYTGRDNDGTGLYFYRARYYDPVLKRFISEDPIGLGGGLNLYGYANQAPTIFGDPLGLAPVCSIIHYGSPVQRGTFRENVKPPKIMSNGSGVRIVKSDQPPLAPPGPGGNSPDKLNVCFSVLTKLVLYNKYLVQEEFDLYGRTSTKITYRCTEERECADPRVSLIEIDKEGKDFLRQVSNSREEEEIVAEFTVPMPSPICFARGRGR